MDLSERIGRRLSCRSWLRWSSMGKAAQRLNTTQPRSFEDNDALGVHLLDRSQKGVEPTRVVARCSTAQRQFSMTSVKG